MKAKDKYLFQQLKKEIVEKMRLSYPGISEDITQWKGQDITDFQDELSRNVKEQVSEKWFYTHMKADNDTLPRIDVLNILSRFAGYRSWDEFRHAKTSSPNLKRTISKPSWYFILLPVLTIVILLAFYFAYKGYSTREYKFCFHDAQTGLRIENTLIEVSLLHDDESAESLLCDAEGCLLIKTDLSSITMTVKAPYYQTETFHRKLERADRTEKIMLNANKYALMIHHFSRSSMEERQRRKEQLNEMISNDAIIYMASDDEPNGMKICSKWEFIDMLMLTSADSSHVEVLEAKYRYGKITILRFRQVKEKI